MKISTKIEYNRITVSEPQISDVYFIFQFKDESGFFATSDNGYDTRGSIELKTIEGALKHVKSVIKNYFLNRCENNPKGW